MLLPLATLLGAAITWYLLVTPEQKPTAVEIAMQAQQQLGAKLKAALTAGGPVNALDVCSVEALALTQSVADKYGATLRRATLRPRNPYNLADSVEAEVLRRMEAQLAATGTIDTITIADDVSDGNEGSSTFIPIRIVEQPCMACHGSVNGTITPETYRAIKEKYPDDKATGYKPGELRGAWVVTMK